MGQRGVEGVVGALGRVTTRIRGPGQPGEVQVAFAGGSEPFIAYSDVPLEVGATVLVVAHHPGRSLDVTAFDG